MKNYLSNITPDSVSGLIFALEGIQGGIVLLNGPTGCKFYHSATADYQTMKQLEFDPMSYPELWFFGQPRVPCTYLDCRDYVYGSREKLEDAIKFIKDNVAFDFIAIVNSPGAALIGDDLKGIAENALPSIPCVILETPGFSKNICIGYENCAIEIISQLNRKEIPSENLKAKALSVNLIGMSIFERNHQGDLAEIKRLLELCGIDVNCVLFDGCSLEEIRNLSAAALNIVVNAEYGEKTAKYLKDKYGTPFYIALPPIGFYATEKMIKEICDLLGANYQKFMVESEKSRARAYLYMSRFNSLTGLPKGATFGVEGNWSSVYAYTSFLWNYFGLVLKGVSVLNKQCNFYEKKYLELISENQCYKSLKNDELKECEVVFANGNTIARLKLEGEDFVGIENGLPSLGYIDVIPKTHMGLKGSLFLVEQIINALTMK